MQADEDAAEYPPKYVEYLKAGLSRSTIEATLSSDGYSIEEVQEFWIAVTTKALEEACNSSLRESYDLTSIWSGLSKFQHFGSCEKTLVPSSEWSRPPPKGFMRFVCVSDTHSLHDKLPDIPYGDVLLHAGDFTDTGDRNEVIAFDKFLSQQPHKYKVVIAGNHESALHSEFYEHNWETYGHKVKHNSDEVRSLLHHGVYLQDQSVTINGIRIYGTPWQPKFSSWAFNMERGENLIQKWRSIPQDTDILITHTPPLGRGDSIGEENVRVGDVDLLKEIQHRVCPSFHVFGHVHEGYGSSSDGTTTYINASSCTKEYKLINLPVVFDFPCRPDDSSFKLDNTYDQLLLNAQNERTKWAKLYLNTVELPGPIDAAETLIRIQKLKHLRIEGTVSDEIFQKQLIRRPVGTYDKRALKYLFKDGADTAKDLKRRILCNGDTGSEARGSPDYSISSRAVLKSVGTLKRRRQRLERRISVSVLQDEVNCSKISLNNEIKGRRDFDPEPPVTFRARRTLVRRDVVANLPTFDNSEEGKAISDSAKLSSNTRNEDNNMDVENPSECVLCEKAVSGHVHREASNTVRAITTTTAEEECIMCKFKVSGHVCENSAKVELDKPVIESKESSVDEECGKKSELNQWPSSWF